MQDMSFDSTDIGATEDFLVKAYTKMQIGGEGESPRTRIERRWLGSIAVDQLSLTYDMGYDANPLEKVTLCRVRSGSIASSFNGVDDVYGPGDVTLVAPPGLPYSGRVCAATYDLAMLDTRELDRVASAEGGSTPVRLLGHRPVTPEAGQRLSAFLGYLRTTVAGTPRAHASTLVASTATSHLASIVLDTFPTNAQAEATAADRHDATPTTLRRAIAYVEENAQNDITISDLAQHVYLTPRGVQYMFRRYLDCTPMEYTRQVRLQRAHRDLLDADPNLVTVTQVAVKWGFAHTGRFASRYRQQFGAYPQETLRA